MSVEPASAGDAIPPKYQVIEVRVAELRQLFNAIDPSPFRERDLDPRAEAFIVDWSRDLRSDTPLALVVHLERAAGRISLAIGLAFLASSIAIGDALASSFQESRVTQILRESLLIGGWVAMWRPLEVFLYNWWPIREEARLFDRLSAMPVTIVYTPDASSDAWRSDWPAVPASGPSPMARAPERSHASEKIREAALDQRIEAPFPASDPPS